MKRIEIRGVIVPSAFDDPLCEDWIAKGILTPESRFRKAVAEANDDVEVYINSRGGSVFSGNEMVNALRKFKATGKRLEITVGALAASMGANLIVLSGADHIRAHANTKFMFHSATMLTFGGSGAHSDSADMLKSVNADVIAMLEKLPGAKKDVVAGWFEEGRQGWLSAQEAKDIGLVSEIIGTDDTALAALDEAVSKKLLESGYDATAFDFKEPKPQAPETVLKSEFDALAISKANLQSAKDREISALISERDGFKATAERLTAELGTATAALSAEKAAHGTTKDALATESKRRTDAEAKHAALVGGVIGGAPGGASQNEATGMDRLINAINEKMEATDA